MVPIPVYLVLSRGLRLVEPCASGRPDGLEHYQGVLHMGAVGSSILGDPLAKGNFHYISLSTTTYIIYTHT